MRIIPGKIKASIPDCIVTELEDLLRTESIGSLKKLSDRIDSAMFLSNAQRGWARYWLRSELSILCNTSNSYRFMGYSHLGVFITDAPMGGYNAFAVPEENIRRVCMSPFDSLEKLVHWLTIN